MSIYFYELYTDKNCAIYLEILGGPFTVTIMNSTNNKKKTVM